MKQIVFFLLIFSLISCNEKENIPAITVKNEVLNPVNSHLFGQFMEKCSWGGEIGGDLVINPKTGTFDSLILDQLKSLNIPNIRYPGGTDVDYFDWTDMIDHAPGQTERKPYYAYRQGNGDSIVSDNRLGMNEFLDLCEILEAEPILVLNIGNAYIKKESIQQAQENAAALLTYCKFEEVNHGPDWPDYREKNGREKPWKVKYFEIGNEYWGFEGFKWKQPPFDRADVEHLFKCIQAVADTLHALDPDVKIIVDGAIPELNNLFEDKMKDKISYIVFHPYLPWGVDRINYADGKEVDYTRLSDEDIWNAWVATPYIDTITGFSRIVDDHWTNTALSTPFQVACTEWNWNGWLEGKPRKQDLPESDLAKGIGAAGFLHSFMRMGSRIEMASQSMLLGKNWGITGIRVDPEYIQNSVFLPTLQVTGLYSNYHGNELLNTEYENIPVYSQPYQMNAIQAYSKVALLDILSTRSENQFFIHIINRSYNENFELKLNLEGLNPKKEYKRHSIIGNKKAEISNNNLQHAAEIITTEHRKNNRTWILEIPESSVSVFVFNLK